jgi:hypothetical protein
VNTGDLHRTPGMPPFRGINFSSLEIDADLGGAVFVVGSVVSLLIGVPSARMFFAGTLVGGTLLATAIAWWHRRHPSPIVDHARTGVFGKP